MDGMEYTNANFYVQNGRNLMTSARLDDHVSVFLQNDVRVVVKVENRNGGQLNGRTTRLGYAVWVH